MSRAGARDRSLASRLMGVSLGAAGIALLVAGVALNVAMFLIHRAVLQEDAVAQARVIAANSAAALLFADVAAGAEVVGSLSRSPRVARATLYDLRGAVFADFRRDANAAGAPPPPAPGAVQGFADLVIVETIEAAQGPVGWLRLQVPMAPLYRESVLFGAITALAAGVALLLARALVIGVRREVIRVEQRLDNLAFHDPVTQLFNRHAANEHLESAIETARDGGGTFAVASFDLDDFKTVNDTLGHALGDELLREVAARLRRALRDGERGYRLGGDEFIVITPGGGDPLRYARLVADVFGRALAVQGHELVISSSVGVARFPADGASAAEVLQAADIAMYHSKAQGTGAITLFDARLREAMQNRLRTESELRTALREGQLRLMYQPVVHLASGRVVGAEALVRWAHPTRGLLGPAEFIEIAERSGLVVELGGWVLREAARRVAHWQRSGLGGLRLAVNVSARQLKGRRLVEQLREAVQGAGLEGHQVGIEIELTEHTLVEDLDENLSLLNELRDAGVRVAIDDFGTGLSSLSYLKKLPVDKLKIDRSFVKGLPQDDGDGAIVGAALSMAQALGLKVVAEGVETEAQRRFLVDRGCDFGQGWLFGQPMAAEPFEALVQPAPAPATPPYAPTLKI